MHKPPSFWFLTTYPLAYAIFCLIYLPHFLLRTKRAEDPGRVLRERLGSYHPKKFKALQGRKVIWVHAVSVGEVMAAQIFLERTLAVSPDLDIVLTTVTPTGQSIAQTYAQERLHVVYMPFDFRFSVRRFLKTFHPMVLLLMETELWPQALIQAQAAGLPVGILNARLSEKSTRRYRQFQWFFKPLFQRLDFVLAQSQEDSDRFQEVGVAPSKMQVMGNMKFDNVSLEPVSENILEGYRKSWAITNRERIWVAGSTHPGEEEIIFRVFQALKQKYPDLKCIIAPRHIERAQELKKQAELRGLRVNLSRSHCEERSDEAVYNGKQEIASPPTRNDLSFSWDILILNELGSLKQVYGLAEVVYVGGSLVPHGGQNPIEPAALRCAILHGPNVFNFKSIYQGLDASQGAVLVNHEQDLKCSLETLLENPDQRRRLGENAFRVVSVAQGSSRRHVDWIFNFLSLSPLERMSYVMRSEKLFSSSC